MSPATLLIHSVVLALLPSCGGGSDAPVFAAYTPLFAGFQLDNTSGTGLLSYQIDKTYAAEFFSTLAKASIA